VVVVGNGVMNTFVVEPGTIKDLGAGTIRVPAFLFVRPDWTTPHGRFLQLERKDKSRTKAVLYRTTRITSDESTRIAGLRWSLACVQTGLGCGSHEGL
jgi:hypothetical protein